MSKLLNKSGKLTNLKPDFWYEEYSKIWSLGEAESKNKLIEEAKEWDIEADKWKDYDKYNYCNFYEIEDGEFICTEIHGKYLNDLDINKKLLEQCKEDVKHLKTLDLKYPDYYSDYYKKILTQTQKAIKLYEEALKQGHLISTQLVSLCGDVVANYVYEEEIIQSLHNGVELYKQFKFRNYQEELFNFIKSNTNYRDEDRDFKIYKQIQKGNLYSEIAEKLGCSVSNISKINKKVQSSINNLKGKFFEIKYEKYLKSLNKFLNCKIVRDGNPGKPDIYVTDEYKKNLYVFSIKNLELNKKSFCITKEQLKPELEFAYYKSAFEGYKNVVLYLIVFDSLTENLYVRELDFKNPSNVNIQH